MSAKKKRQVGFVIGQADREDSDGATLGALVDNEGFTLVLSGHDAWARSRYGWRQIVQLLIDVDPHQFGHLTGETAHHVFPELLADLGFTVVNWQTGERWSSAARSKIACFSCGRSIDSGETYVCVSRLRKKREAAMQDDTPVETGSSLQICHECANSARAGPIPLSDLPVPVTKLEKQGFYWFVAHHVGRCKPWKFSVSEERCSLCGVDIKLGESYTLVEIAREKVEADDSITQLETVPLAAACSTCSFHVLLDVSPSG